MKQQAACPHCGGTIEFEAEQNGAESQCPHCSNPVVLQTHQPEADPQTTTSEDTQTASGWRRLTDLFPGKHKKELQQARQAEQRLQHISTIMQKVREGTWKVKTPNVVMLMGERALWSESVTLVAPTALGLKPSGAGSGLTQKLKLLTSRLPGFSAPAGGPNAALGRGELVVTNYRLVFLGGPKSFITRLGDAMNVQLLETGMMFAERGKPKTGHSSTSSRMEIL